MHKLVTSVSKVHPFTGHISDFTLLHHRDLHGALSEVCIFTLAVSYPYKLAHFNTGLLQCILPNRLYLGPRSGEWQKLGEGGFGQVLQGY